jgi:anti-sigma factor RsiW
MTEYQHPTCPELLDQLSDYIDGELDAAFCAEIESHLSECSDCRIMVDTLRKTITLYRTGSDRDLPADVQSRLFKVLKLGE